MRNSAYEPRWERHGDIASLVAGRGAVGIVAGPVGATALTRVMTTLLFGICAFDVVTFASRTLILSFASFAATARSAGRAASADPMLALREAQVFWCVRSARPQVLFCQTVACDESTRVLVTGPAS